MTRVVIVFAIAMGLPAVAAPRINQFDCGFPIGYVLGDSVGVVFPSLATSARSNASALALFENEGAIEVANARAFPTGVGPYEGFLGIAQGFSGFGLGAGYFGDMTVATTNGAFFGTGFKMGNLGFGLTASDTFGMAGSDSIDASVLIPIQKRVRLVAVITQLESSPQATFGLGLKEDKFTFEYDIRIPPLKNFSQPYQMLAALSFLVGKLSFYSSVAYQTASTQGLSYTEGLGLWLNPYVHVLTEYSSLKRLGAAINVNF